MSETEDFDPRREVVYRMGVLAFAAMLVLHMSGMLLPPPAQPAVETTLASLGQTLGARLTPQEASQFKGSPMDLAFTRSGGFAGAATEVKGTVSFSAAGAEVTSLGTSYRRSLVADEANALRAMQEAALKAEPTPAQPSTRDAFLYSVSLVRADGKTHEMVLDAANAGLAELLKWVQAETQRIWEYKIAHRATP